MTAKLLSTVALFVIAGCNPQTPEPEPTPPPIKPQVAALPEPLDPFVVMIDAERWGVIIDKALEGVREAPDPTYDARIEDEMFRADAALKSGAARMLGLRNEVCAKGLLAGAACEIRDWPEWTGEPPSHDTPIEEINRRSQWLGEAMQPFTNVGCEAGRKATGEELFCSVE